MQIFKRIYVIITLFIRNVIFVVIHIEIYIKQFYVYVKYENIVKRMMEIIHLFDCMLSKNVNKKDKNKEIFTITKGTQDFYLYDDRFLRMTKIE
jgi:hypothetical protein